MRIGLNAVSSLPLASQEVDEVMELAVSTVTSAFRARVVAYLHRIPTDAVNPRDTDFVAGNVKGTTAPGEGLQLTCKETGRHVGGFS